MKLTQKQALVMFDILKHALQFVGGFAGYTTKTLQDMVEQILDQQSDEPIELTEVIEDGKDNTVR